MNGHPSSEEIVFNTPCEHEIVVKAVKTIGGPCQGKWFCRIRGPSVTGVSGMKTVYADPNELAAKKKIAAFLKIPVDSIEKIGGKISTPPTPQGNHHQQPSVKRDHHYQLSPAKQDLVYNVRAGLREKIRLIRLEFAKEYKWSPFIIFDDKTLDEFVAECPTNDRDLLQIRGMGAEKLKRYGPRILEAIREDRRGFL